METRTQRRDLWTQQGEEGEGGMCGQKHGHLHYHMQKRQPMGICCLSQGTQTSLCNNLEGWDGEGSGREGQEGGDICVPMTDSCGCMAESNTIL